MASQMPTSVPSGRAAFIGIPESEDIPRLVYCAPYFTQVPLAELIEPSVIEAVNNVLPSLVPPYVDAAAQAAVQQLAVLLTGSTMTGPLFLSPLMPTQPSQAATMAYVDSMIATAGIPEVPPVPSGQVWARETGQWVPITPQTGVFLPLAGGSMVGNINMSGNTIQNMAAVPAMPNGAAPAQWVLNQIASVSLYQGTWDADTNVPDLTQLSTHVNAYTWIALTTAPGGVVIGPAIPGLQGTTVFNGDTIIYSTVQGAFKAIHSGGITLPEADGRYVQLAGSQMSGALLLNANASQPLQAVTLQQLQAFVPPGAVGEAPNDGQLYGRNGLTHAWSPVLPLAGGIMTGAITLAANAVQPLQPTSLQQMNSAISAAVAPYVPLAGATMTGLLVLSGNASAALNPVPLQQLNSMLASYAPIQNPVFTGTVTLPGNAAGPLQAVPLQQLTAGYLPLTGGTLSGGLTVQGAFQANGAFIVSNGTINGGAGGLTLNAGTTVAGNLSTNGNFTATGSITSTNGNHIATGTGANGTLASYNSAANVAFCWYTGPSNFFWFASCTGAGVPSSNLARFGPDGGFLLNSSGKGWQAGGGPWQDTSDSRIKTVDSAYAKGLAEISQLAPVNYHFLGNDTHEEVSGAAPYTQSGHYAVRDKTYIGLVADAVMGPFPECVTLTEGYINGAQVSDLKTLDTGPLVYALINAVKELGQRVSALDGKPV